VELINFHQNLAFFQCGAYLLLNALGIQLDAERIDCSQLLLQFNKQKKKNITYNAE